MGVRDGRSLAPAPVARRPRVCAGRPGPDLQQTPGVHPGNRAPACPDGVHVDHGDRHGVTADVPFAGELWLPVNQGDIRRRASHIECKYLLTPGAPSHVARSRQTARRTGQQQMHRLAARLTGLDGRTGALHDRQGRRRQGRLQALEIAVHQRPHVGVEPGGHTPLVLLVLPQHRRRSADEDALGHDALDGSLEALIQKREQ